MATLQEQFDKAEHDKKAAQKRMTKLRKKIQQQEAREKREKEKREREQLLVTQQEVGAFVLDYLAPWLDTKLFTANDEWGNPTTCSVWDAFKAEVPLPEDCSIPNVLTECNSSDSETEESDEFTEGE